MPAERYPVRHLLRPGPGNRAADIGAGKDCEERMTATVKTEGNRASVFLFGMDLSPNAARELARKLIENAHACDKYNRRNHVTEDNMLKMTSEITTR